MLLALHCRSVPTIMGAQAHRAQHIIYDIIGVDVGFDNPIFAVIEMDYTEADEPGGKSCMILPSVRCDHS